MKQIMEIKDWAEATRPAENRGALLPSSLSSHRTSNHQFVLLNMFWMSVLVESYQHPGLVSDVMSFNSHWFSTPAWSWTPGHRVLPGPHRATVGKADKNPTLCFSSCVTPWWTGEQGPSPWRWRRRWTEGWGGSDTSWVPLLEEVWSPTLRLLLSCRDAFWRCTTTTTTLTSKGRRSGGWWLQERRVAHVVSGQEVTENIVKKYSEYIKEIWTKHSSYISAREWVLKREKLRSLAE